MYLTICKNRSYMIRSRLIILLVLVGWSVNLAAQLDYTIHKEYQTSIQELLSSDDMKSAFEYIISLEDETEQNHIRLTEVEAPPFMESERGKVFMDMLQATEITDVRIDDVGNVIGRLAGTEGERTVALDAHLDTVFPKGTDVKVKIKNDTLFAPGIGDDTRGLAMLLTIAKTIQDEEIKFRDDVLIIASVGEEGLGDLRGVKHLFGPDGPDIDSWISIDGGDVGRVNNKGLGSYRYRVTFSGPGGHSWGAFGLVNPHHALGDAINRFVERADDYTATGPRTSYNIGVISGGTSVNSIPYESKMEIDTRSIDPSRLDTLKGLLETSVQEALDAQNERRRIGKELTVAIDMIGNRPSGELSSDLPLIQRALAATAALGKRPQLTRGSTNSNVPISLGIPAVTIGRGGIGAYGHSLDEWWLNKEGYKAIHLAFLLLATEAGLVN